VAALFFKGRMPWQDIKMICIHLFLNDGLVDNCHRMKVYLMSLFIMGHRGWCCDFYCFLWRILRNLFVVADFWVQTVPCDGSWRSGILRWSSGHSATLFVCSKKVYLLKCRLYL
jgi:hypothetical protein